MLAQWILKVNHIVNHSPMVFQQLGEIIPLWLQKNAERWFFSLPLSYQVQASASWRTIRDVIRVYYMNSAWLDWQKARANQASFRESDYTSETPRKYFVRKVELL